MYACRYQRVERLLWAAELSAHSIAVNVAPLAMYA
jgi:hypothetical protein